MEYQVRLFILLPQILFPATLKPTTTHAAAPAPAAATVPDPSGEAL